MVKIIGLAKRDIEEKGMQKTLPKDKIIPEMVMSIYPAAAHDNSKIGRRIRDEYYFDASSPAKMPVNNMTDSVREVIRYFFGTDNRNLENMLNGVGNVKEIINDKLVAVNYQIGLYREGLDKVYVPSPAERDQDRNLAWSEIAKNSELGLSDMVR